MVPAQSVVYFCSKGKWVQQEVVTSCVFAITMRHVLSQGLSCFDPAFLRQQLVRKVYLGS